MKNTVLWDVTLVVLVITDVSEESITSIMVKIINELHMGHTCSTID
jgi:hypothetical protein